MTTEFPFRQCTSHCNVIAEIINVRDDVLVRWFYPVMTRVEQEQYCIVFSDRQAELNYCILVFL